MATATLLPNGEQQFIDGNGVPYAGGQVYFYIPNTSTLKNTWQNVGQTILNTNPVILDGAGRAIIYGSGQYRQVLQDSSGNTVWDQLTQDVYGLVMSSDNEFTGVNTFDNNVIFKSGISFTTGPFPIAYAAGTVNAITATYSPIVTSLTDKRQLAVIVTGKNTSTTPTFSPDGLAAHTITTRGGQALQLGDIGQSGYVALLEYNLANTRWELMNPCGSGASSSYSQDFRLTLTSGTPVTISNVSSAMTIYCTPYKGNSISLYNGSTWDSFNSAQFSLALGTLTSGLPYDIFCYSNSGVPTLEFLAWTDDVTRATALAYQDGILVKSGSPTRRYMGTFYTTSTTTTEDSQTKRYLWNYYNRVYRDFLRQESTASWTYTTATVRQANANTANQIEFVRGVSEDAIDVTLNVSMEASSTSDNSFGLGLDTTTSINIGQGSGGDLVNQTENRAALYYGLPSAGRHYIAWLEAALGATTTWYGQLTIGGGTTVSGLNGGILA